MEDDTSQPPVTFIFQDPDGLILSTDSDLMRQWLSEEAPAGLQHSNISPMAGPPLMSELTPGAVPLDDVGLGLDDGDGEGSNTSFLTGSAPPQLSSPVLSSFSLLGISELPNPSLLFPPTPDTGTGSNDGSLYNYDILSAPPNTLNFAHQFVGNTTTSPSPSSEVPNREARPSIHIHTGEDLDVQQSPASPNGPGDVFSHHQHLFSTHSLSPGTTDVSSLPSPLSSMTQSPEHSSFCVRTGSSDFSRSQERRGDVPLSFYDVDAQAQNGGGLGQVLGEAMRGRGRGRSILGDKRSAERGRCSSRHSPYGRAMMSRSASRKSAPEAVGGASTFHVQPQPRTFASEDQGDNDNERLRQHPWSRSPSFADMGFPRLRNFSGPGAIEGLPYSQLFGTGASSGTSAGFFDATGRGGQPRHASTGTNVHIVPPQFVQDGDGSMSRAKAWALSLATSTFDDEPDPLPPEVNVQPVQPSASAPTSVPKTRVASEAIVQAANSRRKTEGKHKCDYPGCEADFTTKNNLQNHINSHLGIRQFKCVHCERDFGTAHVLRRHLKTCKGSGVRKKCSSPPS